ncbi:hypothetical protein Q8F55_003996 [Vanrija albida]|uniref:Zn(2)-C6 fungal-type domain-containing protein n=1 Tax=Vanrija albida TaxID=181172 RepID=A0ABR3Q6B0_9TREE
MASVGRPRQACLPCYKRKIKCDRGYPCAQCISRGSQARCDNPTELPKRRSPEAPRRRSASPPARRARSRSLSAPADLGVLTTDAVAFTAARCAEVAREPVFVSTMLDVFGLGLRTTADMLRGVARTPVLGPAAREAVERAIGQLPSAYEASVLVAFYFESAEWLTRVLDGDGYAAEVASQLDANDPAPAALALHFAVLCVAMHLADAGTRAVLGLTEPEGQERAAAYYATSKELLLASDFFANHNLESLQCIVLYGVYLYNTDAGPDEHAALLGAAIKIGYGLGLNRLAADGAIPDELWPPAWRSAARRDLGRRVWWALVSYDWTLSRVAAGTYCIAPRLNFTVLPGNHDAVADGAAPMDTYTSASCFILRRHYDTLQRECQDHRADHGACDYAFVLTRSDTRLAALEQLLPAHYASLAGAQAAAARLSRPVVAEYLVLRVVHAARIVRTHRPFMLLGLTDAAYAPSVERCATAAERILRDVQLASVHAPLLLSYWVLLNEAYYAAMILFFHLAYAASAAQRDAQRALLQTTLSTFHHAAATSAIARNASRILDGLLAAEDQIRAIRLTSGCAARSAQGQTLRQVIERIVGIGGDAAPDPAEVPQPLDLSWLFAPDGTINDLSAASVFPPGDSVDLDALLGLVGWDGSPPPA